MNIHLNKLILKLKRSEEIIEFSDVSYFYGKMGAGKTSIAKLIDYCFGSDFEYSPALQQEFVSVSLDLTINHNPVIIQRPKESNSVIVSYTLLDENFSLVIPISPDGEVIPDSNVESLSDFIFYIAGMKPPKVRKSKTKSDSKLQRLSIRNLLWYCYLDQDEIDSDFFNLGVDANIWKRLSSRDVLRFIIGFHQEKVSELEESLTELRDKRRGLSTAANTLRDVLIESSIDTYEEIYTELESFKKEGLELESNLSSLKSNVKKANNGHSTDNLKNQARILFYEIESLEIAIREIKELISRDSRHLNEIQMLKLKVKRDESARMALLSVSYTSCPSCLKSLPNRNLGLCAICGQEEVNESYSDEAAKALEVDAESRVKDLIISIRDHKLQLEKLESSKKQFEIEKTRLDQRLTEQLAAYDSAYLSTIIESEKELIIVKEKIVHLEKLQELPLRVNKLQADAESLTPEIKEMNKELKVVRSEAEKDTKNLKKLEHIFLDMLLDSKFPGIKTEDSVSISSPNFLPEVMDSNIGDLAVTSFSNLSSGGKKTIFKSCFALAVHVLARQTKNAILPTLIIIDSPMKNISERENKEVFEGFIELIYSLASDKLKGTQFIVIDKEYYPPPEENEFSHMSRHMQPDSEEFPPLIPYYKGH